MRLAVISLGHRNAGKSNTWYELFGRVIRSGYKRLQLDKQKIEVLVKNSSFEETGEEIDDYVNVFVQNSSFEENGGDIDSWFDSDELPNIFLCSVQYTKHGINTINWLKEKGYYLYIQWVNPGYTEAEYLDSLGFENKFKEYGVFTKCSGKEKFKRVSEIKDFLIKWLLANRKPAIK